MAAVLPAAQALLSTRLMKLLDCSSEEFVRDVGLGIDAGGTETRWALVSTAGEVVASGAVAGVTGLQMNTTVGRSSRWSRARRRP